MSVIGRSLTQRRRTREVHREAKTMNTLREKTLLVSLYSLYFLLSDFLLKSPHVYMTMKVHSFSG